MIKNFKTYFFYQEDWENGEGREGGGGGEGEEGRVGDEGRNGHHPPPPPPPPYPHKLDRKSHIGQFNSSCSNHRMLLWTRKSRPIVVPARHAIFQRKVLTAI